MKLSLQRLLTISLCSFSLIYTGCQHIKKSPTLTSNQATKPSINDFKITGKIGVRTPEQTGSAFFGWTQIGDSFAIELTGALGIGQTKIYGEQGKVTLTSSKTGTIEAANAEELLFKATGWITPITGLISWINGKPNTPQAITQYDDTGRMIFVQELGWQASLNYTSQQRFPSKLTLIDDSQQNRITMVIQNRE